jgi:alkylation response protein AidB-like acyl-CoA dehydrogenase
MDFLYTEEQRMLADSLRRLVDQAWTFPRRRARQAAGKLDAQAWGALAELGVLGLNISQDFGGFGEVPPACCRCTSNWGAGWCPSLSFPARSWARR